MHRALIKSGVYTRRVESNKCAWHTIEETFLPPGSITETGTAHGGGGGADAVAGETAGNWRQLDAVASLKPEIALASTFLVRGNQSEGNDEVILYISNVGVARATRDKSAEAIESLKITRTRE